MPIKSELLEHGKRLLLGALALGGYLGFIWAVVEVGGGTAFAACLFLAFSYLAGFILRASRTPPNTEGQSNVE